MISMPFVLFCLLLLLGLGWTSGEGSYWECFDQTPEVVSRAFRSSLGDVTSGGDPFSQSDPHAYCAQAGSNVG